MRKERLIYNSVSSLIYQIILFLSGFILPRLIIEAYGSEINGLTNSITQYLSIISFLEFGVGAVVKSALYLPLAKNDNNNLSAIMKSANCFFRKLATILLIYVVVLIFVFPAISKGNYGFVFTALLIASISISSFAQYFFGIANQLLLTADQKVYINNIAQTITLIVNIILSVFLIRIGSSIQIVKLVSSLVFLARPIYLSIYVKKNYEINTHCKYEKEPIQQKWSGIAQHIAAIVLDSTDIIILSTFSSFVNVSIYSVYRLVLNGLRTILQTLNNGFGALLGELWAKKEMDTLNNVFRGMEWLFHTATTFVYGCCFTMMLSFVALYTQGINDANYIHPTFSYVMIAAFTINCYTIPYHTMILAAGHYRETQVYFIISAIINLIVSITTVSLYGLIGVAIGTLIAMIFQLVWMVVYVSRHLNYWPLIRFAKQVIVDILTLVIGLVITKFLVSANTSDYVSWIIHAIISTVCWGMLVIVINSLIYRKNMMDIKMRIIKRKK